MHHWSLADSLAYSIWSEKVVLQYFSLHLSQFTNEFMSLMQGKTETNGSKYLTISHKEAKLSSSFHTLGKAKGIKN